MTIRTVLLVFLSALAALFAVVNWQAIMAVVPVNLLFTQINAPLGLIIIVGFGALWLFVLVWAIMQQASVVFELRRAYKEVHANKTLAENAEKSRLQEARTAVSVTLILISASLTALGWYDHLAKVAGAGTLVPITGFANAVASPALEFRAEGMITGLGAKLFAVSGPVLVYGVAASMVYGFVLWGLSLLGVAL